MLKAVQGPVQAQLFCYQRNVISAVAAPAQLPTAACLRSVSADLLSLNVSRDVHTANGMAWHGMAHSSISNMPGKVVDCPSRMITHATKATWGAQTRLMGQEVTEGNDWWPVSCATFLGCEC